MGLLWVIMQETETQADRIQLLDTTLVVNAAKAETQLLDTTQVTVGSGQDNVMFGDQAGRQNSGNYNVFIGTRAGYHGWDGSYSNSGDYNVFIGNRSSSNQSVSNSGSGNTFIGNETGKNNTTGEVMSLLVIQWEKKTRKGEITSLLGVGKRGQGVTTGDKNIFIGGTRSGGLSKTIKQEIGS